ncbi:class I SAM-dependent methyltransferase [Dyadobacter psychrotolerans]|uniref:Class I SAM-dependent methyltransferase n=1 Tax=Dyadobacter psychrotolerans TaxID=2541721 RepID=A0A4R5D9L4_9BACT|nr:class I SAM-dependent methyltransferase [Dyadobacter psychrotolerans]TDE10269.1 class I SAM-dependent methyltransferase [Dyadobacter psychrotolerans]
MINFKTFFAKKDPLYIKEYKPKKYVKPEKMIDIVSAWQGLEMIIEDIQLQFGLGNNTCIEFGVEFGYSAVVLSNYFNNVIGVDTFEGDIHTTNKNQHYEETQQRLASFNGIKLFKSDYKDWIRRDSEHYDLAHVDIVHTYEDTYQCGLWASQHSDCTLFHDTESYPDVKKAVLDIAKKTGQQIYNYPLHFGLGILVNKRSLRKR